MLQGRSKKSIKFDTEDYRKIMKHKWYFIDDSNSGHAYTKVGKKTIYLHRYLMGATKGTEIDHINRDGLDNRKINLRFVTHQENMVNRPKHKNNTSGITGVNWNKHAGKWKAQIQRFGKNIHLGYFETLDEAERARHIVQ